MADIRVLVVDDAVVVRKTVSDILTASPGIEVAGVAPNGKIALAKIPRLNPDIVILDIDMPEMDGLETLVEIRKLYPTLPVVMFSVLTERCAAATMKALSLGANDYVAKPSNVDVAGSANEYIRAELVPKIKIFCRDVHAEKNMRTTDRPRSTSDDEDALPTPKEVPKPPLVQKPRARLEIIAIGVSTGGPSALADLMPKIPKNIPIPIAIVQHLPKYFTKHLVDRLNECSSLKFHEGLEGMLLEPGRVYVAPGNFHMELRKCGEDVRVHVNQNERENSCRPAVDVLFRSVAKVYGNHGLGVVLTGMGKDGLEGSKLIVQEGGRVMVQDEQTSVIWGMPGYVARNGLADKILPLADIADDVINRVLFQRPGWVPKFS